MDTTYELEIDSNRDTRKMPRVQEFGTLGAAQAVYERTDTRGCHSEYGDVDGGEYCVTLRRLPVDQDGEAMDPVTIACKVVRALSA